MGHNSYTGMSYNYINTTGATSEPETAYLSGAPEFTPVFSGARSLVLCVCFVVVVCHFVLFLLVIVLSVLLPFTDGF